MTPVEDHEKVDAAKPASTAGDQHDGNLSQNEKLVEDSVPPKGIDYDPESQRPNGRAAGTHGRRHTVYLSVEPLLLDDKRLVGGLICMILLLLFIIVCVLALCLLHAKGQLW